MIRMGLSAALPFSLAYDLAWLVEAAAYCAVDCFALISGYVGYGRRHGCAGLASLCAQTAFYTLGATLAFLALRGREGQRGGGAVPAVPADGTLRARPRG